MKIKKKITLSFYLLLLTVALNATLIPASLICENLRDPMAVDITRPRLSWINISPDNTRGQHQTAFEIRVAGSPENLQSPIAGLWNSGKVISCKSVNIEYDGVPLQSRQDCWWQVRVWDREGNPSGWSEPAFWSMGLLEPEEWIAGWIGAPWQDETPHGTAISSWKREGGEIYLHVRIPVNTVANIIIPVTSPDRVTESGIPVRQSEYIEIAESFNGKLSLVIGSGEYRFCFEHPL